MAGRPTWSSLTVTLAREMLAAVGHHRRRPGRRAGRRPGDGPLADLIAAQGGDVDAALPVARESHDLLAEHDGVLTRLDAYAVGVAAWRLGAGRARRGDPVSAGAGVRLHAKPGDRVTAGQRLATMFADDPARFARAEAGLVGRRDRVRAGHGCACG